MQKHGQIILIVILLVSYLHAPVLALTNEEVFSQFQFNFITPGARATAMGGAFIGLADDATAAVSNPAGLTILTEPEVSLEFKHITYTTERLFANPLTLDNLNFETFVVESDVTRKEFDDFVMSVPFMSMVYPYKRVVFSLYRQELVNYRSSFRTSQPYIFVPYTLLPILPVDATLEVTVTNYGMGAAVQLFDWLALAVSPRWSEMKMNAQNIRFDPTIDNLFEGTDFSDEHIAMKSDIDDVDGGFCVNAGILLKPHPKVSLGAVYKNGRRFTVKQTQNRRYYDEDFAQFTLNVPDSYGVGIVFRATDFFTLTLDVVHIRYKDLLDDFDALGASYDLADIQITSTYYQAYQAENFTVDDATEVHVGLEYLLLLGEQFLALRAGMYTNPDHTIRFTGTTGDNEDDIKGELLFPKGDDQIHFTCGLGLVINDRFQFDTAANIAKQNKQLSFSAVYRF